MSLAADKSSRVIVALDFSDLDACRSLLDELKGLIHYYKIGTELFSAEGWKAVELVRDSGAKVFLDLKLHDIPTTVAKTARVIVKRGVWMFNVHALGGGEMMRRAREAVDEARGDSERPLLVAVTLLTSHGADAIQKELGLNRPLGEEVVHLARLAKASGLDGVISSPEETALLRKELGAGFLLVNPGIRPQGTSSDDQRRSLTPREALDKGADYLVLGRSITASPRPREVVAQILQSLA